MATEEEPGAVDPELAERVRRHKEALADFSDAVRDIEEAKRQPNEFEKARFSEAIGCLAHANYDGAAIELDPIVMGEPQPPDDRVRLDPVAERIDLAFLKRILRYLSTEPTQRYPILGSAAWPIYPE